MNVDRFQSNLTLKNKSKISKHLALLERKIKKMKSNCTSVKFSNEDCVSEVQESRTVRFVDNDAPAESDRVLVSPVGNRKNPAPYCPSSPTSSDAELVVSVPNLDAESLMECDTF